MADVLSAPRAKLLVNGNEVGYASNVSATENIALQRVDVLGDIDSKEIVPVARSVSVQAGFVRISGESLKDLGLIPRGGTIDVLTFPELTLEVFDQVSDQPVWRIEGCRAESRNWTVQAGSIVTSNASFQARRIYDERG
jgi:hypothetical protein